MAPSQITIELLSSSDAPANVTVVKVGGVLDVTSASEARGTLARLTEGPRGTFELDLEDLAFVDSLGIGALLETQISLKRRGDRVFLTNLRRPIRRVFEVVHALPSEVIFESRAALDAYLRSVQETDPRG